LFDFFDIFLEETEESRAFFDIQKLFKRAGAAAF